MCKTDSECCAFPSKIFGKLPKNTISKNYKITNKRPISCAKELVQNVSWSHVSQSIVGWKRARHYGPIANRRSGAIRDFSRNVNCCFARFPRWNCSICLGRGGVREGKSGEVRGRVREREGRGGEGRVLTAVVSWSTRCVYFVRPERPKFLTWKRGIKVRGELGSREQQRKGLVRERGHQSRPITCMTLGKTVLSKRSSSVGLAKSRLYVSSSSSCKQTNNQCGIT